MIIRISKIIPPKGEGLPQVLNIAQSIIYFGVWVSVFCAIAVNAGHSFGESYLQACLISFAANLAMSQLTYPHKAGGHNPALESNENMQDRHSRFLHNALIYGSLLGFYLALGWVAAWLFVKCLSGVWGL